MWPIIFASSAHPSVSAIPGFKMKMVDWVPVDVAARTVGDILLSGNEEGYKVHHVVNPCPIPWESLVQMLQGSKLVSVEGKKMDCIPMKEWVQRLAALAEAGASPDEVPGLRLLQFFESMALEEEEERTKFFETAKTREISESLRGCETFNQGWVDGNVKSWKMIGFLP